MKYFVPIVVVQTVTAVSRSESVMLPCTEVLNELWYRSSQDLNLCQEVYLRETRHCYSDIGYCW